MASISFHIKRNYVDKHGLSIVVLTYSHQCQRFRKNVGIKVNPLHTEIVYDLTYETWTFTSSKKNLMPMERERIIAADVDLKKIYSDVKRAISSLKTKSLPLKPENVENEFLKDAVKKIGVNDKAALIWYQEYIEIKELEIGTGINSYRSTFNHLKTFMDSKGVVLLMDFTRQFLEDFKVFLLSKKLAANTIHKQFKNLRFFLNWVIAQDEVGSFHVNMSFKKFHLKARYGDPIGLTVVQFFQLKNIDLRERPGLEVARDLFVFAVAIGGPRFNDLKSISKSLERNEFNLNRNTITYFETKTGNPHQEIVLNELAMGILNKYHNKLPAVPCNQPMNRNLRKIAYLLNWDEIKFIPLYNTFGKLINVKEVPLKDIFSTKFMRKTAATIDNMLGISAKTSMRRTGHKTFDAYSRYVDVNKDAMSEANLQWDRFIADFQMSVC